LHALRKRPRPKEETTNNKLREDLHQKKETQRGSRTGVLVPAMATKEANKIADGGQMKGTNLSLFP